MNELSEDSKLVAVIPLEELEIIAKAADEIGFPRSELLAIRDNDDKNILIIYSLINNIDSEKLINKYAELSIAKSARNEIDQIERELNGQDIG